MPAVTRKGDSCTGHGCWPPRGSTQGSGDVFANAIAVHRQGDAWAPHTCPAIPETHAGALASGSGTVFVNGRQIGRIGDPVDCGSSVASGSGDVFAGG
ncbi:PAAR domain-containing protein [Pseudophaeobacter sp. 1A09344]|uniref:PAAR domain-containing protein n=1 Tax=Pseudophaeobacter sp. 1A09344 TaxID=3098144 RepID=UPI0034D76CC9